MNILLVSTTQGYTSMRSRKSKVAGSQFFPPLSLLYVAKAIEDEGHKVKLIDSYIEPNPIKTIQNSLSSFDAVGLEVYTYNIQHVKHLAKSIKNCDREIPLIIGGPHCTFNPNDSLVDIPFSDISLEGEGEIAIKDIMKALDGKKKLADIPGVYFRKDRKIKKGRPAEIIKDLDSIAFPSRHLLDKYKYGRHNGFSILKPRVTSFLSSRGCPFSCRFCTRHVTTMKSFRMRSAENVLEEIREIQGKYKSIIIYDDNFLSNKKRIHKILDELIKNKYDLNLYITGARVDSAKRDLYIKMKKAGVKQITYGIESGNQEIIDYYNKKISLDQIRKAVNLSNEMDFITIGNFLIGAPIETKKQILDTIKFACSIPLDLAMFYSLHFQLGSDLWHEAVNDGKIVKKPGIYGYLSSSENGLSNISQKEIVYYLKKAFSNFYYRPTYFLRQLGKTVKRKDATVLRLILSQML